MDTITREYAPYQLLPLADKDYYRTLSEGLDAVKASGAHYWISAGTLLGLHRDGDYIPHDTDIDVAVIGNIDRNLLPDDFKLIRTVDMGEYQMQEAYMHEPTQIIFDIFNHHPQDETRYFNRRDDDQIIYTEKRLVDTLGELEYKGLIIPVPNDLDAYLTAWYGDWRTPITNGKREWDKCE